MVLIAEKIRNVLFWTLDFLNRGKVSKHFKAISHVINNYPGSKDIVEKRLAEILKHASDTTSFYKNYTGAAFIDYPVIDKNIIRQNESEFISSSFDVKTLSKAVTSGSTGTPFSVYHNINKKLRNTADTIYFAKSAGFELGQKLYYFKVWNGINKKSKFDEWSQNVIACNVFELSDEAIEKILKKVNTDKSNIGFLAYASAFDAICRYLELNKNFKIKAKIKSVIAMSESLNDYTKEAMQRHFKCKCISRYSNVENGIIAQQSLNGGKEYYINLASYYVEILNMHDNGICAKGQEGRIVVTDLYNEGMPMIRYDTGDIGVMNEKMVDGRKIPVLEKIEGRKMDMVFNTNGDLVSSFTITNNMWKYTEIKQYQFIQISKNKYLFKLNCDLPFSREAILINEFQQYFGLGAEINVEYVNGIPLLNSGKRKKVMNIYKA
jgi:phenylacetate-CoA ligase